MRLHFSTLFIAFVIVFLSACEDNTNPWPAIAKADLDYIKQMVERNHPGYVDPNNPQFKTQLEQHYKNVINQLQYVQSLDAVLNLDNEFIASFADYHMSISLRFVTAYPVWAGMKIERRNEKYVVTKLVDDWSVALPNIGAELIGCDGRAAKEIMNYDILRYRYANYEAEYPRVKYASKFFIDDGVGFRKRAEKCVFRNAENKEMNFELKWMALGNHTTAEWDTSVVKPDTFSIEKLSESVVWIRLPSFQPEDAALEKASALLKSLEDMGAGPDKTIVFDVRGNGGGYLGSATAYVLSVYGIPNFLSLFLQDIKQSDQLLRASPAHLERRKKSFSTDIKNDEQRKHEQAQISVLEQAINQGLPFAKKPDQQIDFNIADKRPIEEIRKNLPKLIVFADHFCASECLTFVELVLHEPKNIHLGATTFADSAYSLIYSKYPFELPSKLGSINLPLAIFGQDGPFTPSIKFDGDMNDTAAIKQWFMGLNLPDTH
jgi:hypothetical protein